MHHISFSKIVAKLAAIFLYPFTFGRFDRSSRIDAPLRIDGKKNIFIGAKCLIQKGTWLGALPLTNTNAKLIIGDGVRLGHSNHIYATGSITIEPNVLTADRVYITDNVHEYQDVDTPVINQPIRQLQPVVIGEGSWLGENACIIGASIGKHCVVGANSVVARNAPPYCVLVGAPAVIIKRYDPDMKCWRKTLPTGEFV